jgi:hypothetical protein
MQQWGKYKKAIYIDFVLYISRGNDMLCCTHPEIIHIYMFIKGGSK